MICGFDSLEKLFPFLIIGETGGLLIGNGKLLMFTDIETFIRRIVKKGH